MSARWEPPIPAMPKSRRNELCRRCARRRGEHEGIGDRQWCRGTARRVVFEASGLSQEPGGQGQLSLSVEAT